MYEFDLSLDLTDTHLKPINKKNNKRVDESFNLDLGLVYNIKITRRKDEREKNKDSNK